MAARQCPRKHIEEKQEEDAQVIPQVHGKPPLHKVAIPECSSAGNSLSHEAYTPPLRLDLYSQA